VNDITSSPVGITAPSASVISTSSSLFPFSETPGNTESLIPFFTTRTHVRARGASFTQLVLELLIIIIGILSTWHLDVINGVLGIIASILVVGDIIYNQTPVILLTSFILNLLATVSGTVPIVLNLIAVISLIVKPLEAARASIHWVFDLEKKFGDYSIIPVLFVIIAVQTIAEIVRIISATATYRFRKALLTAITFERNEATLQDPKFLSL